MSDPAPSANPAASDDTTPLPLRPDFTERYALHIACRDGRASLVQELLAQNPKLARRQDEDSRLPIHWAVSQNHLEVLELLLSGAYPEVNEPDGLGWTPLMIACNVRDGERMVERLLAAGADVNAKNDKGQTALFFAVSKANLPVVRRLLKEGAGVRVRDKMGRFPIHRAAAVGAGPVVAELLDRDSPVDPKDSDGWTPFHHAVAEGWGDVAVLLLRRGADSSVKDAEGRVAMLDAPDRKVVEFILGEVKEEGINVAME